jgi:hypothetical protein
MKQFLKSKFSTTMVILTMASSLSLLSCEGPEGPAGLDGLEGAQGVQGATGAQGPAGPAGASGTSNVIYSPWITNVWEKVPNPLFVQHTFAAPLITQAVLDKGVVLVYFKESADSNFIKILPSAFYLNGELIFTIDSFFELGKLTVFHGISKAPNGEGIETFRPDSQTRYIIIPGGVAGRIKYPVDFNNYEEVCSYFGIQP